MQRIEILSVDVHTKSGTSKAGKPYMIREQEAVLHDTSKKYPQPCRVLLEDEAQPWAVGFYDLGSPLSVGRFESLQVNRGLGLVPSKTPARAA